MLLLRPGHLRRDPVLRVPEVTDAICWLPLPRLLYRSCSLWRLDADIGRPILSGTNINHTDPRCFTRTMTVSLTKQSDVVTQQRPVFEKTCVTTQKNVKSHVFWILKKNVKKRTYSFTGHLITPGFNTQLPKVSTGKSPTSNILLRNADTRNYAITAVCDKRLHPHNYHEFWGQNIYRHIFSKFDTFI